MNTTTGSGMSRAAQKRRKKQEKDARPNKIQSIETSINKDTLSHVASRNIVDSLVTITTQKSKVLTTNKHLQSPHNVHKQNNNSTQFKKFSDILDYQNKPNVEYTDVASSLLSFFIQPIQLKEFYDSFWSHTLYHSNRKKQYHFNGILSRSDIETTMKTHLLYYTKDIVLSSSKSAIQIISGGNIDIEENDDHETKRNNNDDDVNMNEETNKSKVLSFIEIRQKDIWASFQHGDSLCWLSASQYNDVIWKLLSLLEIEFESVVNCQVYLIPPNGKSFGYRKAFADLLVLQIEGNSHWEILTANDATTTINDSNHNSNNNNISNNNSSNSSSSSNDKSSSSSSSSNNTLELQLLQGDFTYIPKHSTFEASYSPSTQCDTHSLYLIIYINEQDNYKNMLEMVLPLALHETMALRQQLPQLHHHHQQQQQNKSNNSKNSSSSSSSSANKASTESNQQRFPPRTLPFQSFSFLGVAHSELENEVEDAENAEEVEANTKVVNDLNKTLKVKSIQKSIMTTSVGNAKNNNGDDNEKDSNNDDNDHHNDEEEEDDDDNDDDDEEHKNILLAATINANRKQRVQQLLHHRESFFHDLQRHLNLISVAAVGLTDAAVDQVKKQFMIDRLPVPLTSSEEKYSAYGFPTATIMPYTALRMIRPNIACMVVEDGKVLLYHCMDNSRELYNSAVSPLEFELDDGPAIEELLGAYPAPVTVDELSHSSEELEDKVSIAQALYKEGFLLITDETTRSSRPRAQKQGGATNKQKGGVKKVNKNDDDDDDDNSDDDDNDDIF